MMTDDRQSLIGLSSDAKVLAVAVPWKSLGIGTAIRGEYTME